MFSSPLRESVVLKEGSTGYLKKHILNIVLVSTMYEGKGPRPPEKFSGSGVASETVQPLLRYVHLTLIPGQDMRLRTISVVQLEFILGITVSYWSAVEDYCLRVEQP